MKWFNNPKTLEDLKKQYYKLAMQYHPDRGGDEESMKQINNEYAKLFEQLKNIHQAANGSTYTTGGESHEKVNDYQNLINMLVNLEGIKIEICGSWLWISGDTKPHKETLKRLKFRWSQSKKAWYFHNTPYHKRSNKNLTLDEIRDLYGSETIKNNPPLRMQIV